MKEVCGVYKILCLVNGKFYIGSSKDIYRRWYNHWDERQRAKTKNQLMYDDMRKYGKENFRIYVIYEGNDYKNIEKKVTYNLQPLYNIRNKTSKTPYVKLFNTRGDYLRHYYKTHKEYYKNYYTNHKLKICEYSKKYYEKRGKS